MNLRRYAALLGCALTFAAAANPVTPLLGADALLPRLQKGELIVVVRHQRAAMAGHWDDFTRPDADCTAQRNLSPAGYAAAAETGQALRILNVPFGTVLASPLCRTMDTARLLFGKAAARTALGHATPARQRSDALTGRELVEVLRDVKLLGGNAAIVTHGGNVLAAYGHSLSEGDMLFFVPGPDGPMLIGRASASAFDLSANASLIEQAKAPAVR